MKKLLYHIDIGDGDNLFMLAEDKQEVKQRIDKQGEFSSDMINSIVELPHIQYQIEKWERERIIEVIRETASQVVISSGETFYFELGEELPTRKTPDYIEVRIHPETELWQALKGEEVKE